MRSMAFARLIFGTFVTASGDSAHFWCHKNADGLCVASTEDHFSEEEMRDFVHRMSSTPSSTSSSQTVDASSIRDKVLAGYQGWTGARKTWDHWSNDGQPPDPSRANEHFEMVPKVDELPSGALHDTNFRHIGDGSSVKLYENAYEGVVDKHFQWMKDYGLDGVLLQRFISECTQAGSRALTQRNTILEQADVAAARHGRVYAMMWDISGAESTWDTDIKNDWNNYVKAYTFNQQYLKENGKPVVVIFGIGMTHQTHATSTASLDLIYWLQAQGLYVIGSGPYYWRTGEHDSVSGFDNVHAAFDAIMPWSVGRYNTVTDFNHNKIPRIRDDAALTSSRGQGYAPIAFAGYSYRDSDKVNYIKRNAGQFFQAQIDSYLDTPGVTFYYIAMFDEVQEGTAIYKFAANDAESAAGRPFVTASSDGVDCPADFYLAMAGQFAARAHGSPAPSPATGSQIQSSLSGLCVDLPGSDTSNGALLWTWECYGGNSQQWSFQDGALVYLPDASKCVDLLGGDSTNGSPLGLWDCYGGDSQQWGFDPDMGTIYLASSAASDASKCVAVSGMGSGDRLMIWDCNPGPYTGPSQVWTVGSALDVQSSALLV